MKTSLTLLLCLIFCEMGIANAIAVDQNKTKKESKLYQLLDTENFEKLHIKSSKILKKDKRNPHANYTMTAYYMHKISIDKSDISRKNSMSRAMRYLRYVPTENTVEFNAISDSLHNLLKIMAFDSSLKKNTNNQYRNWLLVYFNDSVPPFKITKINTVRLTVLDSAKIGDSLRYTMLKMAQGLEGVRYIYGGSDPSKGFDCSGFTQYVYNQAGLKLPHNAQLQSELSPKRVNIDNLKPGDLVFFGSWSGSTQRTIHAGIIFAKNGDELTVVHCVSGGVSIEGTNSSWDRYWIHRVLFGISMDTIAKK